MSIWKRIFSNKDTAVKNSSPIATSDTATPTMPKPSSSQANPAQAEAQQAQPPVTNVQAKSTSTWRFAEDKGRGVRQVILSFTGELTTPSRFKSTFTYPGHFKEMFYDQTPFATGFFRTDRDQGPFLLVRCWGSFGKEETVDSLKAFRVAITFIQRPTSGLVAVFVTGGMLSLISNKGHIERFYGLDEALTRDLLADAISKEAIYVALDGDSGFKYDARLSLDDSCRQVLAREWQNMLAYHKGIKLPDYRKAAQEAFNSFPEKTDPIL